MSSSMIEVTLVSGFQGAGKTTLLSKIAPAGTARTAVVAHGELEDVLMAVAEHVNEGNVDRIFIEMSPAAEPLALLDALTSDEVAPLFGDRVHVGGIVTVVDAVSFLDDFGSDDELADRELEIDDEDDRAVALLVTDQIECANVLVISKTKDVPADHVASLKSLLAVLNPSAKIVTDAEASRELLTADNVAEPDLFSEQAGWVHALADAHKAAFVFRARKPFHPQRFAELLHAGGEPWRNVVRSKGAFWIATQHNLAGEWSQAGGSGMTSVAGAWFASVDPAQLSAEERAYVQPHWEMPWGDRRQELVFLGQGIDHKTLGGALEKALLTDEEMKLGPEGWLKFEDPFQGWSEQHEHVHGPDCNHDHDHAHDHGHAHGHHVHGPNCKH